MIQAGGNVDWDGEEAFQSSRHMGSPGSGSGSLMLASQHMCRFKGHAGPPWLPNVRLPGATLNLLPCRQPSIGYLLPYVKLPIHLESRSVQKAWNWKVVPRFQGTPGLTDMQWELRNVLFQIPRITYSAMPDLKYLAWQDMPFLESV